MRIKMTDGEKEIQLAMAVSSLVHDTCIRLKIEPYDAVKVLATNLMVLAITSARGGREAYVALDIVGIIWELGTDIIDRKRREEDDESSVQRNH
jgi:hypothetical protein